MSKLPENMFIADNGDLMRFGSDAPIRRAYQYHYSDIKNVAQLKATLRAGAYAWPGGYPIYLLLSDGESISFDTCRAELRQIMQSVRDKSSDGWRVVGAYINWEDNDLIDVHTGAKLESAYGE